MCEFDKSLCGCSLKTGSKIIGYLSLISSILTLILGGVSLSVVNSDKVDTTKLTPDEIHLLKSLLWITIVTSVVLLLASVSLLYGVYKGEHAFMLPWLVLKAISIVLMLIVVAIGIKNTGMGSQPVFNIISESLPASSVDYRRCSQCCETCLVTS